MRILLIFPPSVATDTTVGFVSVGQPLGVSYLAAAARRAGHEVTVCDALQEGFLKANQGQDFQPVAVQRISNGLAQRAPLDPPFAPGSFTIGLTIDQLLARVKQIQPDLVGVSALFTSVALVSLEICRRIKELSPDIATVMGGAHPTILPVDTLTRGSVDYVVWGEGESAFVELIGSLEDGRRNPSVPGLCYLGKDGHPVVNPPKLIENLDAIPFPAFDMLPMEHYFDTAAEGRIVKMITSRGCTFDCCFCSVPYTSKRKFRTRSPANVTAEIDQWVSRYGINGIMFEDDNLTLNVKRARALFDAIVERDYGLRLYARNFRADLFDLHMLQQMKRAGFDLIWITPESGNQRILDQAIGKKLDLKQVELSVQLMRKAGLRVAAAFVIGLPQETRADINDTVAYARKLKRLGVEQFWFSIATPMAGTRLYETARAQGLIREMDLAHFSYYDASFSTEHWRGDDLVRLRNDLMDELNDSPKHEMQAAL